MLFYVCGHDNHDKSTTTIGGINMKKVIGFIIDRYEGFTHECGPQEATTWEAAEAIVAKMAETAPPTGEGYDKAGFTLTYEDGFTYEGRIDLQEEMSLQSDNLASHIRANVEYYIKSSRPEWMKEDRWRAAQEDAQDFITNYEIGGNE
jgi:hypothetical protein